MIDIKKAEKEFDRYVLNYDEKNLKIFLKKEHTKRVQKEAADIAKYLNLNEEDSKLAELIGLLHDVGRFEQVKRYNTFSDKKSIDHAKLGTEILFNDGYIRKFVEDEQYDTIIYKAILNHNKYKIEENMTDRELLHSKIIRDADKIDILRLEVTEPLEALFENNDIEWQEVSEDVYKDFFAHKNIDINKRKTDLDKWILAISFIFDLNFQISYKKIKENNSIHNMIARFDYKNEDTKVKMHKIEEEAEKYIKEKLEEF